VLEFVGWLREWNDALPSTAPKVGFYGLDLYSLHASMEAVVAYLERVDPEAAQRARERYSCFDHFGPLRVHIDETSAVEPLEPTSEWEQGELPETYPWAV
jgi:erythromycin esterase-like protein